MTQKLNLEIIEPSNVADPNRKRAVDITPFRVGRDAGNNWVLEDELKQISRTHFIIEYINNVFTIIDVSSNGVSLNSAQQPIGRGKSSVLNHGDVIVLSGFKIRASILESPSKDRVDPFLDLLPERGQQKLVYDDSDDIFSTHAGHFSLPAQGSVPGPRLPDNLPGNLSVDSPDRFLMAEERETDFNFDRTPADLARFDPVTPEGHGIPENWFDDDVADTTVVDPPLDSENRSGENNDELLKLLLAQLAILEKAVSVDGDLLLSPEPKETLIRLSAMDERTLTYVVKAIFSQALVKLENSGLRQTLAETSKNKTNASEPDLPDIADRPVI